MTLINEEMVDRNDEQISANLDSFTLIQSRRIQGNKGPEDISISLCPSMDIMWLQSSLYRTLGLNNNNNGAATSTAPRLAVVPHEPDTKRVTPAWRPDGRWLASSPDGSSVQLHALESLISIPSASEASSVGSGDAVGSIVSFIPKRNSGNKNDNDMSTLATSIRMLTWAQVSNGHWQWQQEPSKYSSYSTNGVYNSGISLILPFSPKLPPSEYHNIPVELPTLQTPLTVLVILLQDGTLDLYLHGRYPLLVGCQLLTSDEICDRALQVCATPDLTHYLFARSSCSPVTVCVSTVLASGACTSF